MIGVIIAGVVSIALVLGFTPVALRALKRTGFKVHEDSSLVNFQERFRDDSAKFARPEADETLTALQREEELRMLQEAWHNSK